MRDGIAGTPRTADLHHALGLRLVRKGDKPVAPPVLARRRRLAPDNARYAMCTPWPLNQPGKRAEALALLRAATAVIRRHGRPECPGPLNREAGDVKAALVYAKKAAEIDPADDPGVKRLLAELETRQ